MNWLTVLWSMAAAVCLALAFVHLLAWLQDRRKRERIWFSLAAIGASGVALTELMAMKAETIDQYAWILRSTHAPLALLHVSLIKFVRSYFCSGRRWLAVVVSSFWIILFVANLFLPYSSIYHEITGLNHRSSLGESFVVGYGKINEWAALACILGISAMLVFLVDATVTAWRQGERRRATVVGGSMILFIVSGTVQSALVDNEVIQVPYMIGFSFLAIVMAMGFELSSDLAYASRLSRDLEESERRMSLAAEAANLGLWVWDIPTDDVWMTPQGRVLYGFDPTEKLDLQSFIEKLHPEDRETARAEITTSLSNGGVYESKHRVASADGQMRWVSALGRAEFDDNHHPLRMLGVTLDISQVRNTELEILRQRGELAHLSRVAMLGELSGSLAHELNQPLSAILSNAQAAQLFLDHEGIVLPDLDEMLEDIVEADERAGEVIRRLRLLLRKGELQMQPLDINDLADEVLKLMHSDLINNEVSVQTDLAPGLPAVRGDRVQLQQVILNLIMNACDAMAGDPPAERRLTVSTSLEDEGNIRVSVEDQGTGLPENSEGEIFAPYFTTKPHGMGLGLSVCRTILATHNGSLDAVNNPDRGATFRFILPLSKVTDS